MKIFKSFKSLNAFTIRNLFIKIEILRTKSFCMVKLFKWFEPFPKKNFSNAFTDRKFLIEMKKSTKKYICSKKLFKGLKWLIFFFF